MSDAEKKFFEAIENPPAPTQDLRDLLRENRAPTPADDDILLTLEAIAIWSGGLETDPKGWVGDDIRRAIAEIERLRARVAELEPIESEAAEIRRKWGIETDESLTECVERNIDGWKERALKAEQRIAELEAAQALK